MTSELLFKSNARLYPSGRLMMDSATSGTIEPMLTKPQIERVWEDKMTAEARSAYFAAIAARESGLKRLVTAVTFILSSAAVVTLLSQAPRGWSVFLPPSSQAQMGIRSLLGRMARFGPPPNYILDGFNLSKSTARSGPIRTTKTRKM
jgi:hypothetical protein